jgi:predicted RNase H-like nuclease (RuvC/YqgF family)
MEMEALQTTVERLAIAAGMLEQTVERLEARHSAMDGEVQRIVATVEQQSGSSRREHELELKLQDAERQIAELKAQAMTTTGGRRTLPVTTANMLAKQGISTLDQVEAGALDAAMESLSIEQRIAVKSQLLRAGLLG